MTPTHVIFRIDEPGSNEDPWFVEVKIGDDDFIEQTGQTFGVTPGDSYLKMTYSQVVLVYKQDSVSSNDIAWFTIFDPEGEPALVNKIPYSSLRRSVKAVLEEYRKSIN